jgi:acetyltransferase-like isoleucine patch superfamily enzyme
MLYDDEYIARAIRGEYSTELATRLNLSERMMALTLKSGMAVAYAGILILCHIPFLSLLLETFVRTFSRGAVGFFLRGAYYKNRLKRMGKNVFIDVGVTIWTPENVEIDDGAHIDTNVTILGGSRDHGSVQIGKYVHVASNCMIAGRGGIKIGDYAAIAAGSNIYSGSNYYQDPQDKAGRLLSMSGVAPLDMQYVIEEPVIIEEYGFISLNSTVLPGVRVGKAAVVGAHSLVTTDIPPFSVAVGTPAKVIKQRPEPKRAA